MAEMWNHVEKLWDAITNVKGDKIVTYTTKNSNRVETEEGFNEIIWVSGHEESDTPPAGITWEKVNAEMIRLQAEYDALAYSRARKESYPVTKEFMEAYTEKEIGGDSTKWDAYVVKYNKVRSDNPKP